MGLKRTVNDKEVGLVVSHLPNRKNPVMLAMLGNSGTVIANFRSEEDAEIFDKTLELLVFGKEVNAESDKGVLDQINEKQDSLRVTCKAWDEAISRDGYVD